MRIVTRNRKDIRLDRPESPEELFAQIEAFAPDIINSAPGTSSRASLWDGFPEAHSDELVTFRLAQTGT
jgi:hypothetical protein